MDSDILHIYTDGACSGNPGRGGWGVYIEKGIEKIELNGSDEDTTNNRMELVAVIQALRYVDQNSKIKLFTDSFIDDLGYLLFLNQLKPIAAPYM